MASKALWPAFSARELELAFRSLTPLLADQGGRGHRRTVSDGTIAALRSLAVPMARAGDQGGLLNIWSIAGLRRDELRNAQCLANLWTMDFGGTVSRTFLAAFLDLAIADVDWLAELSEGYHVATEISPLGNQGDRVDLVIETARRTIGIEIKIDAGLGPRQLERYVTAIGTRARWRHAKPHVVLLAPFASALAEVASVTWSTVADAARSVGRARSIGLTFVEESIVSFGEHVRAF